MGPHVAGVQSQSGSRTGVRLALLVVRVPANPSRSLARASTQRGDFVGARNLSGAATPGVRRGRRQDPPGGVHRPFGAVRNRIESAPVTWWQILLRVAGGVVLLWLALVGCLLWASGNQPDRTQPGAGLRRRRNHCRHRVQIRDQSRGVGALERHWPGTPQGVQSIRTLASLRSDVGYSFLQPENVKVLIRGGVDERSEHLAR